MKVVGLIAAVVLHISTAQASAATVWAPVASCGDWLVERQSQSEMAIQYQNFVSGFVSGVALGEAFPKEALAASTPAGVYTWIDGYCQRQPLDQLSEATYAATRAILKKARSRKSN